MRLPIHSVVERVAHHTRHSARRVAHAHHIHRPQTTTTAANGTASSRRCARRRAVARQRRGHGGRGDAFDELVHGGVRRCAHQDALAAGDALADDFDEDGGFTGT